MPTFRTNADKVAELVEVDDDIDLTPFMTAANALVTELCLESGYTDARLAIIEAWLAAHFYTVRDNRVTSERAGPVASTYSINTAFFFKNSMQGQQALLMDTAGNLAKLQLEMENGGPRKVGLTYLGTSCYPYPGYIG